MERRSADNALVLVSHGERQVPDPNRSLADHAAALAAQDNFRYVGYGVLNGEPPFEAALKEAMKSGAKNILVYPFFMSDGYFVSSVLAERIASAETGITPTILSPLGHDDELIQVLIGNALTAANASGFVPKKTRLLIVGHGSKYERASAEATYRVADALVAEDQFMGVSCAFLEESPFIDDQLASEKSPVVVLGFFAGNGMHSSDDVPAAILKSGARAVYAGPVGIQPEVRKMIDAACENCQVDPF